MSSSGNTPNNYLYAGEQYDHDLNLYYNRARYLEVSRGRFWSQDSFEGNTEEPLSLHKYLYGNNDPVNKIDPSGNFGINATFAIGVSSILANISALNLMETVSSVLQDPNDIQTVKLNIVYENTIYNGFHFKYSEQEKEQIRNSFVYFANFGFGNIDIKFQITETDGEVENLYSPARQITVGYVEGSLNAYFTKRRGFSYSPGVTTPAGSFIESQSDPKNLLHELLHQIHYNRKNGYGLIEAEIVTVQLERDLLAGRRDYTKKGFVWYFLRLWAAEYAAPPTNPRKY